MTVGYLISLSTFAITVNHGSLQAEMSVALTVNVDLTVPCISTLILRVIHVAHVLVDDLPVLDLILGIALAALVASKQILH